MTLGCRLIYRFGSKEALAPATLATLGVLRGQDRQCSLLSVEMQEKLKTLVDICCAPEYIHSLGKCSVIASSSIASMALSSHECEEMQKNFAKHKSLTRNITTSIFPNTGILFLLCAADLLFTALLHPTLLVCNINFEWSTRLYLIKHGRCYLLSPLRSGTRRIRSQISISIGIASSYRW
ncbi:hypothetical protein F5Y08DRAFT_96536 [Xylaria arbuscula]|nr:hypothetical protein F5Y08DRAFT_96536 [Xylaria arbuscula]